MHLTTTQQGDTKVFTKFHTRKRAGAAALSLALFASACGGGAAPAEEAAAPAVTEPAAAAEALAAGPGLPQLTGDTVAGTQFDTSELAGQDIAVWFWAPW